MRRQEEQQACEAQGSEQLNPLQKQIEDLTFEGIAREQEYKTEIEDVLAKHKKIVGACEELNERLAEIEARYGRLQDQPQQNSNYGQLLARVVNQAKHIIRLNQVNANAQKDLADAATRVKELYEQNRWLSERNIELQEAITLLKVEKEAAQEESRVLMKAEQSLKRQIERLANYIMNNIPGEPSQSQGLVDSAIRIMEEQKTANEELNRQIVELNRHVLALARDRNADAIRYYIVSGERGALKAQEVQRLIAGALYDFVGWLTSRNEQLVLSAHDLAGPAAVAIVQFAKMRGLSLDQPEIENWQDKIK